MDGSKLDDPIMILGAARTPLGAFQGGFAGLPATELGAVAIKAALEDAGVSGDQVDEVLMGNVLSAGLGQAPARQAAIHGGIPGTVPAMTINKVCGSGLKAVMLAAQAIKAGDIQVAVAGGMESMSNVPFYARGLRTGVNRARIAKLTCSTHVAPARLMEMGFRFPTDLAGGLRAWRDEAEAFR